MFTFRIILIKIDIQNLNTSLVEIKIGGLDKCFWRRLSDKLDESWGRKGRSQGWVQVYLNNWMKSGIIYWDEEILSRTRLWMEQ